MEHSISDILCLPERVQYPSVIPDPKHAVGRGDPVGVGLLGIAKESVWDPDLPHHVAVQTQDLHRAVEFQAPVVPGLSEKDVNGVFLGAGKDKKKGTVLCNFKIRSWPPAACWGS